MRRRVSGALAGTLKYPDSIFLPSGGVGYYPPSEARVMAALLREAGIPEQKILIEERSTDTLSSIRNCIQILRALPAFSRVVVCTDVYHIPRCRWLFFLAGISTEAGEIESGRAQNSLFRWVFYYLREIAAFPVDTFLALRARHNLK